MEQAIMILFSILYGIILIVGDLFYCLLAVYQSAAEVIGAEGLKTGPRWDIIIKNKC